MSIADKIISGSYNKVVNSNSANTTYSSSIANSIIDGTFSNSRRNKEKEDEEERLRKIREEREAKQREEQRKQQEEQKKQEKEKEEQEVKKQLDDKITYGPSTANSGKQSFEERKNKASNKEKSEEKKHTSSETERTEQKKDYNKLSNIEKLKIAEELNKTLPTARTQPILSTENLGNLKEYGTPVEASKDIYSEDSSKRMAAKIRYGLDRFKNSIKETPNKILNFTDTLYGNRLENDSEYQNILLKNVNNDELKKAVEEKRNKDISEVTERIKHRQANSNANEIYSSALPKDVQTAGNLGDTVGSMIPTIALSAINPALGDMAMFATSAGQESGNLIDDGYDYKKSGLTGGLKGLTEVATEKLTGGIKFRGKGVLDDVVGNAIATKTKGKVSNFLLTKGYQMGGEIGEEYISNVAGYGLDKLILDKKTSFSDAWEDTKETTKMTFLTTLTLNLMGLGGANFSNNTNTSVNQQLVNEYENITKKKLNEDEKIDLLNKVDQIKREIEDVEEINQLQQQEMLQEQGMTPMMNNVAETASNEGSFTKQQELLNNIENNQETLNNNQNRKEVSIEPIEKIASLLSEGGYRSQEQINSLLEDIKENGIKKPIELIKNSNGEIIINDGNHRLAIAKELGLKEIPVTYLDEDINSLKDIEKYNKELYNEASDTIKGEYNNDINGTSKRFDSYIERSRDIGRDNNTDNISDENTGTTGKNDTIYSGEQKNNNRPSSDSARIENSEWKKIDNENSSESSFSMQQAPSMANNNLATVRKTLNPTEIANTSIENMNTTPKLETKNYKQGSKQSSFVSNILNDAQFLNKDLRQEMAKEDNVRFYNGIANAETLEKAYNSLKEGGEKETLNWFSKNEKNTTAEDVTKGWILLKQYQDSGDYQGAVEVAKKMRQMGTNAGQAVQAYNILSRLTPEGMFYYAQSELSEAYNKMVEGKSKQWIEKNQDKFTLNPEETQTIIDTMQEISNMEDGREKTVKLAQIQKMVSDKIPPTAGQSMKAWMRISMLFNSKTQVRNVLGNAVVLPVNSTGDIFAGVTDKLISKKTGIRTAGMTKEGIKGYVKGFGKGLYESYDDFRKGINTRNVEGNRFEISEGKSFKDKGLGKALNRVDNMLSFSLDAGDRGFYEAAFTNSINNQLVLNKTREVTQDMIDIATNEALSRTWQDDNAYTTAVLQIRKILNKANVKGYGLGDVLIPFAKTPANLTKAIVDYSPVGLAKTLTLEARKFNNSLKNGQYSAQLQHKFVQDLGKGMAGSLLYVLGYGLAKAGIATGEADDDKDVKNFMKNSLGINSYSLKIGDKSFSYDWAQPIATPLAIMTNYVKYSKDNPDASAIDKAVKSLDIGTEQLLQQSFMESLNTVLNGNGSTIENLSQAVLDLPARAIPTFSKQIADMVDSTQRTSFEYGKPVKSAINSVVAKIPFASKTLPATVDTLGNKIQKYGGNNNLWNVMFNPANTNKGKLSKAGEEIYKLYMQTGDTTIFPRTAPYYINNSGEKITMTSAQRSEFQTAEGKYVDKAVSNLLKDSDYKKLSDEKKSEVINQIVSDSYAKAKYDILNIDSKEYEKTRNTLKSVSTTSYYNYKFKTKDLEKDKDKIEVIVNSNYTDKEKTTLYETYIKSKDDKKYEIIKSSYTTSDKLNIDKYLKYKLADANGEFDSDRKDDGTENGKAVYGSAKLKRWNYIENMNITYTQKLLLYGMEYTTSDSEQKQIVNYINNLPGKTQSEKIEILKQFKGFTIYKNGSFKY